jgi:hypothetical protein
MFNEVVAFLSPFFTHENQREAVLLGAFSNQEPLLRRINYAGAASDFVPRLVRVLQHYGEIAPGTQALWQLLLSLKNQIGFGGQQQIDDFKAWANTSHQITLQPGDLAGSTVVTNHNRINIGGNVQGGNVNIGGTQTFQGNVTITVGDMTQTIQKGSAAPSDKEQLQTLVNDLRAALASVPAEHKANVEKVVKRTDELVSEVSEATLDKEGVESKAELLQKAADNIRAVLPSVFAIAASIVTFGRRMAGL